MARAIIRSHYNKQVNVTVKASFSGETLGSAVMFFDDVTGLAYFEWVCNTINFSRFAFRLGADVGLSPADAYMCKLDFVISGYSFVLTRGDGFVMAPKLTIRNPGGYVTAGFVFNTDTLSFIIVSPSSSVPVGKVYSFLVECLLIAN